MPKSGQSKPKSKKKNAKPKDTLSKPIQAQSEQTISMPYIGTYEQAPHFSKDNQHILGGYRIGFDTPGKILKTLFMVHNETVNVWTHFVGAILVILVLGCSVAYISPYTNSEYRFQIERKVDNFMLAIDESATLDKLSHSAKAKINDIKDNLYKSYSKFKNATQQRLDQTDAKLHELKEQLQHKFKASVEALIELKENFETKGAQDIVDTVKKAGNSFNSSYATKIKSEIEGLKNKFIQLSDSDTYDFLDIAKTPNPNFISRWPIFVFLCSAAICLMCSAIFHLFYPMSGSSYKVFQRFDYAGINILISGSTFPGVYYGMYCTPSLATFYLTIVSIVATGLFTLSLFEWMHREEHRVFKSMCYGGFGIFVGIPLVHMLINQWLFDNMGGFTFNASLPFYVALGASYLGGLYMYTIKCPERHYPGKLDICGHSHQIWHVLVFAGIVFTFIASLMNFEERKKCACSST